MTNFLMLELDFGTVNFSRTVTLLILVLQTDIFGKTFVELLTPFQHLFLVVWLLLNFELEIWYRFDLEFFFIKPLFH